VYGSTPTLFGEPVKVRCQGWESRTDILGHAGWEIFTENDAYTDRYHIVIRQPQTGVVCGGWLDRHAFWDRGEGYTRMNYPTVCMGMRMGAKTLIEHVPDWQPPKFIRVEPFPSFRPPQATCLEDLLPFKPMASQQIQIEADPSVDDLLARIIEKQAAGKQAYFEEKVRTGKLVPASTAEILQFSRAA